MNTEQLSAFEFFSFGRLTLILSRLLSAFTAKDLSWSIVWSFLTSYSHEEMEGKWWKMNHQRFSGWTSEIQSDREAPLQLIICSSITQFRWCDKRIMTVFVYLLHTAFWKEQCFIAVMKRKARNTQNRRIEFVFSRVLSALWWRLCSCPGLHLSDYWI